MYALPSHFCIFFYKKCNVSAISSDVRLHPLMIGVVSVLSLEKSVILLAQFVHHNALLMANAKRCMGWGGGGGVSTNRLTTDILHIYCALTLPV